jgi:hypothetical protein
VPRGSPNRIALVVAAAIGAVAFGAAQASASSAPIVISYEKTCTQTTGHCVGTTANGGTFVMQITSFRAAGKAAQLTMTEWITDGSTSFKAELSAHATPAGFIVLNGRVTEGSFTGAEVHQRSNLDGLVGGDPNLTHWLGELQLMPATA